MQIDPAGGSGQTGTAASARDRIGLADNFDSFLKLLTTQLSNQDPLSPLDANQFTQQLVQFSGVEQAIKTNTMLGELVALLGAAQMSSGLDYLGTEVEAAGETVRLAEGGHARLHYSLSQPAATVAISLRDESGQVVFTTTGEGGAGAHDIAWDGRDTTGRRLPAGLYRAEVSALDARGAPLPVETSITGMVDGVEVEGGRLLLSVDGVLVEARSVTSVRRSAGDHAAPA